MLAIEARGVVRGGLAIRVDRGEKIGRKWNEKQADHPHTTREISNVATSTVWNPYIRVRWVLPIWYSNM